MNQENLHLIFVYGTLLRGQPNHHLIAGSRLVRKQTCTMPRFGFVSLGPFPAMLARGTTAVCGELYAVDDVTLTRLDRLEGHPHFYERRVIHLCTGQEVQTYIFAQDSALGSEPIECGDWRRHLTAQGGAL